MPRKKETPKKQPVFKHEAYIEGSGSVVDEKIADTCFLSVIQSVRPVRRLRNGLMKKAYHMS